MNWTKFLLGSLLLSTVTLRALSLGPAELEKVNWESRQLTACDVNGDGLKDLAYINGIERSIDILLQKKAPSLTPSKAKEVAPPMAMTRFTRERIPTEASPSAFVLGDFSGKGKTELAYTAKRQGIVFMERDASGQWTQTRRIPDAEPLPFTHVMWSGALKKGEPANLVVLTKGRALVIRDYAVVASYGTLRDESGFITLNDVNADGKLDMIYDYEAPHGLAYRLQGADGRFDAEKLLGYAAESEKNFAYRGDKIFFFGGNSPFIEERKLTTSALKPRIELYGSFADKAAGTLLDINNDGQDELLMADSKGTELILYHKTDGSWTNPERFPSLKSVSQIVPVGGSGGPQLALFSPDEHAVGLASWDQKVQRISFPQLVELSDEPVQLVGVAGRAWVVTRNDKEFFLQAIFADGTVGTRAKLEGLQRAPEAAFALNENGQALLMLLAGRDPASFYLVSPNGNVTALKLPPALLRSNFTNIDPDRVGQGSLAGSGEDLILSQRGTIRIFHLSKGQLNLADQVLPLNQEANLKFPFIAQGILWAYDARSGNYLKFERDENKLWRNTGQVEAPAFDPHDILPSDHGWITLGRRGFYILDPNSPGTTLSPVKRWESGLKVEGFNWGSLESFDGKTPATVLFSQAKHILEIVSWDEAPKSLLNFEVYNQDPHYSGRTGEDVEPREIITADVTGDSKPDLVMLLHNKILLYPQK